MTNKPMLNIGCGTVILPGPQPDHHRLIPAEVYNYPYWMNVDRNHVQGVDQVVDLFCYPWPFDDNSFSGAIVAHLAEHIPHEIRKSRLLVDTMQAVVTMGDVQISQPLDERLDYFEDLWDELETMQDGWFAFFSELWRVLEDGAMVYVLSPYATSAGALGDPTHTRPIAEQTLYHSMQPSQPGTTFAYKRKMHYKNVMHVYTVSEWFEDLIPEPENGPDWDALDSMEQLERHKRNTQRQIDFRRALATQNNVVTDICGYLQVVK